MTFPFDSLTLGARELGQVIAVLIGIGFGFVLERAGFGRADKLAAQFYLRDMTVFKVMFSAIVTAMLGLVAASAFGLADLRAISESIASWTWIWPMVAGGFLLGVGFIISGYCPGTSLVSAASGNVDGLFAFSGVIAGTFVYSELLQIPAVARFHESGAKEAWFLYDLVPVPPALLAASIALMAVGAFAGAEKVERLMAARAAAPASERGPVVRSIRTAAIAFGSLAVVMLGATAIPRSVDAAELPEPRAIAAADLARRLATEPWRVRLVDVRDGKSIAAGTIPTAERIDVKQLAEVPEDGRLLVVIADSAASLPRGNYARTSYAEWKREPLAAQMGGARPAAPVAARPTGTFTKPKKKGGGCSA